MGVGRGVEAEEARGEGGGGGAADDGEVGGVGGRRGEDGGVVIRVDAEGGDDDVGNVVGAVEGLEGGGEGGEIGDFGVGEESGGWVSLLWCGEVVNVNCNCGAWSVMRVLLEVGSLTRPRNDSAISNPPRAAAPCTAVFRPREHNNGPGHP